MMRKLLWRASLAFVLHCTPAMADHLSTLLRDATAKTAVADMRADYATAQHPRLFPA